MRCTKFLVDQKWEWWRRWWWCGDYEVDCHDYNDDADDDVNINDTLDKPILFYTFNRKNKLFIWETKGIIYDELWKCPYNMNCAYCIYTMDFVTVS